MHKLLALLFILPPCAFGQSTQPFTKAALTNAYVQAIGDFIKTANKKNTAPFDTLFFIKRSFGQPDDFPGLELPRTIERTTTLLIKPDFGSDSYRGHKKRILINLIAWASQENAEFIFVVFSNGFVHQYDYTLNYVYDTKRKAFKLEKIQFKGPPFGK